MNDLRFLRLLYFVFQAVNIFRFGTKKCSVGVIDTIRALCVSPPFAIFLQKHSECVLLPTINICIPCRKCQEIHIPTSPPNTPGGLTKD